jgi:hypothetical protein
MKTVLTIAVTAVVSVYGSAYLMFRKLERDAAAGDYDAQAAAAGLMNWLAP